MIKGALSWTTVVGLSFLVLWLLIGDELEAIAEGSENLRQKQTLLARLESLPEREDSIRRALSELENGVAQRRLYQGDPGSIRREVQRDLRNIASNAGMQIESMRPLSDRRLANTNISATSIQLSYFATNEDSLLFLQRIEEAEPTLRVRRLSIAVQSPSSPERPARLSISMEVAGYSISGGGS